MELQVAGFAFLLGGVAMFAYQIWAWWRHTQQVRDHREICIATVIANSDTLEQETLLYACLYILNLATLPSAQQPCPSG